MIYRYREGIAMAHSSKRRLVITNVTIYLTFAAAISRGFFDIQGYGKLSPMLIVISIYFISLLVETYLISRSVFFLHFLNALQTILTFSLLLLIVKEDYISLMFIPVCIQSILNFPRKTAFIWIGSVSLLMVAALLTSFPIDESVGFVIIYPAAIFLFTSLVYLAKQAEEAQNHSEALLTDLQIANQKLQVYANQVEEFAATNERNRLARELHDSVTQIIFSLTLSAQAARILIDRDPPRAIVELDHLQSLAQSALTEMRTLIQELHPNQSKEEGLIPALRQLVKEIKTNNGLSIDLQIHGSLPLPENIENELIRVIQEALNNIVKHAYTDRAVVKLDLEDPARVLLGIEDEGVGFNPTKLKTQPGHLGLISMQERVQALGGSMVIDSYPGKGTRLAVIIDLELEAENAL
jgi:signal transduction histidine kinase